MPSPKCVYLWVSSLVVEEEAREVLSVAVVLGTLRWGEHVSGRGEHTEINKEGIEFDDITV